MEWTIRPTLRAFPVSIMFIAYMSYMAYSTNNSDAQIHIIMYVIMPALVLLLMAIKGRTYTLENNVITAKRFLQPTQTLSTRSIVDMTVKPVGIRAGHIVFSNAHGAKLIMNNIALSRKRMEVLCRL